jgi:hypothetical protein
MYCINEVVSVSILPNKVHCQRCTMTGLMSLEDEIKTVASNLLGSRSNITKEYPAKALQNRQMGQTRMLRLSAMTDLQSSKIKFFLKFK